MRRLFLVLLLLPAGLSGRTLDVEVHRGKAALALDGTNLGAGSRFSADISPGWHELTARKEGCRDEIRWISGTNAARVEFEMVPTDSFHLLRKIVPCGSHPKEVVVSPDGRWLVFTLLDDSGIDVYDTLGERIVKRVRDLEGASEKGFVEGVFKRDGSEFWFSQMTTGWVYVMDVPSFTVKRVIKNVGNWTKVIEFTPDEAFAYVSNWLGNDVAVIDAKTFRIVRRIPVDGKAPRGLAFSADGKYLWVVCNDSCDILKYEAATGKFLKRTECGGALDRIRPDRDRRYAYIDNMYRRELYEYDLSNDRIVRTLPIPWPNPNNVRLSPDGEWIYLVARGPNNPQSYLLRSPENGRVFAIRRKTFTIEDVFECGNQGVGMSVFPDGSRIAVTSLQDSTVDLWEIHRDWAGKSGRAK